MSDDATAALALLSRMRFACGDNGLRMQDELEQYLIELRRDAERLDALEALLNEQPDGMLLLHHGAGAGRGIVGLGLRNTNRTLRQAIDSARGVIDADRKEGV